VVAIKVQVVAIDQLIHIRASTMLSIIDSRALNLILAIPIRVEVGRRLGISSSLLTEQDTGDAARLVADASAAKPDYFLERAAGTAGSVVDDGIVTAAARKDICILVEGCWDWLDVNFGVLEEKSLPPRERANEAGMMARGVLDSILMCCGVLRGV
jgi:hypothetical protein